MAQTGPGRQLERWTLSQLSAENISETWKPILLYRDNRPIGVGSSFKNNKDQHRILTVAHIFERQSSGCRWTYRPLRPLQNARFPIASASLIPDKELDDVAMCVPGIIGLPPRIIGFSRRFSIGKNGESAGVITSLREHHSATSLITGATIRFLATVETDGCQNFLAAMQTFPGQSGTGFVDGSNGIYVLQGSFPAPQSIAHHVGGADHLSIFSRLTINE